jgi:arylformamidase
MPCWPGDPAVSIETVATVAADGARVSRVVLGSHAGTHIDAPAHFLEEGDGVDAIPPERLVGPCRVLDMRSVGRVIDGAALADANVAAGERLLLRTDRAAVERGTFSPDYVALDLAAARMLVERGVALIGIDAPSIEAFDSIGHPVHRVLLGAGIVVLEGLDLSGVEPGSYELIALPLRLAGLDGSPARVLLGDLA